ncbi:MAG: hypothetical protein WC292_02110 [Clostridia bacterium]
MFIENDVFDIASRLREVDATYRVRFNGKNNKFELYGGRENAFILAFPYDRLDERAVLHARKTRVERLHQLIKELEEENNAIEVAAMNDAKRLTEDQLREGADRVFYEKDHC